MKSQICLTDALQSHSIQLLSEKNRGFVWSFPVKKSSGHFVFNDADDASDQSLLHLMDFDLILNVYFEPFTKHNEPKLI